VTIGLCTIFGIQTLQIYTYAMATYELALAQAVENMNGVEYRLERDPETIQANGLRQTVMRLPEAWELIMVQEVEVGNSVLTVPK